MTNAIMIILKNIDDKDDEDDDGIHHNDGYKSFIYRIMNDNDRTNRGIKHYYMIIMIIMILTRLKVRRYR